MNRFLTFVLLAATVTFFAPTSTVEAGNWTWKRYRLKFWLPKGMRATTNNRRSFIAKGKGIVLKIRAWKSRRGTSVSNARTGYRTYTIIKRKVVRGKKRLKGKYNWKGQKTWRYLYWGTGRYRGQKVYWASIGMANHRNRTHLYMRMWWKSWRHRWVLPRVGKIARRIRTY